VKCAARWRAQQDPTNRSAWRGWCVESRAVLLSMTRPSRGLLSADTEAVALDIARHAPV